MTLPIQPITAGFQPIEAIQPVITPMAQAPSAVVPQTFEGFLTDALKGVNKMGLDADQAVVDWRTGKLENMHEVSLALARADMALRLLVQVRNKGIEAYQDIMRMPI